ncbi:hypothetical protein BLNAU_1448 [Blattamonas nauphoetae]|uniref:Uncharacterized protein n=1 Tax=Blattamonas nauphoetae TaxID=2049346 RepID=A0ABQ9YI23_9EUKA|nr:hypothetical protein BLNAU_1448 [Blattamonas nauphoetae]
MRPHIFLSIPLIVSLFHLTFHADVLPEGDLLNLKPILEELTEARTSNIECRNNPILLHGQYHLFDYVMRSVNISIVGAQSTSIVWSRAEDNQDISNTELSSMLIVTNSTVGLSSLRLICHGDHSSVATIIQSSLSSVFINGYTRRYLDVFNFQHTSELETTRDISASCWDNSTQSQVTGHTTIDRRRFHKRYRSNNGYSVDRWEWTLVFEYRIASRNWPAVRFWVERKQHPAITVGGICFFDDFSDDKCDESSSLHPRHSPPPSRLAKTDFLVNLGMHEPSLWSGF